MKATITKLIKEHEAEEISIAESNYENQTETKKYLKKIHFWIRFFGIIVVIKLIIIGIATLINLITIGTITNQINDLFTL